MRDLHPQCLCVAFVVLIGCADEDVIAASGTGGATSASAGTGAQGGMATGGSSSTGGGSLGTAPPCIARVAPGTWAPVSTNTMADVDPEDDPAVNPNYPNSAPWHGIEGQSAVTDDWNGGALAMHYGEKGSLLTWGGGHQGYYGNEIYAFDLASCTWHRVSDPYAGNIDFPYADGIFPDGTPVPPHTYDQIEYHPPTNSLLVLRTMANNVPENVPVAAMFSFDTRSWRRSPRNSESHHSSGGFSAYDAARDVFWAEGGSGTTAFTRFDPNVDHGDGTFGSFTNHPWKFSITGAVAALDPLNDILVVSTGTELHAVDLTDPDADSVPLTEGGASQLDDGSHGWEWSSVRSTIVYWSSGADVHQVQLSGDWMTGSWEWTNLTDPSNTEMPGEPTNGVFSRFRLVSYDDAEFAVVITDVEAPVYVFRLP